jgi:hypothetical protein
MGSLAVEHRAALVGLPFHFKEMPPILSLGHVLEEFPGFAFVSRGVFALCRRSRVFIRYIELFIDSNVLDFLRVLHQTLHGLDALFDGGMDSFGILEVGPPQFG